MSWADFAISELEKGKSTIIYPRGNSMQGKIESGAKVKLAPLNIPLEVDDIVLVKVKGNVYLHLIKDIEDKKVLIGNNKGRLNGWTSKEFVYGKVTEINDKAV
jgi:hypothetical protein